MSEFDTTQFDNPETKNGFDLKNDSIELREKLFADSGMLAGDKKANESSGKNEARPDLPRPMPPIPPFPYPWPRPFPPFPDDIDRHDPDKDKKEPEKDKKAPEKDKKEPEKDKKDPGKDKKDPEKDRKAPEKDKKPQVPKRRAG